MVFFVVFYVAIDTTTARIEDFTKLKETKNGKKKTRM